jgi:hypothetical protein
MLFAIKDASPKLRKAIIQNCDENLIKALIEIIANTLQGNHELPRKAKNSLNKYKKQLRSAAAPCKNISAKRKILSQKGGAFLPIVLGTILSGVISDLIENARS